MKAIILAAGRGARFGAVTAAKPKPLILLNDKPLICHVLDALPDEITECIIVIGYLGWQIRATLGESYGRLRLRYVEQIRRGTGGALLAASFLVQKGERFLVIGADDLFDKAELARLLIPRVSYGIYYGISNKGATITPVFDDDRLLRGFAAAEYSDDPHYFGVGAYVLPQTIFSESFYVLPNGELSIPHTLATATFGVEVVMFEHWLPVNSVAELLRAEALIASGTAPVF